MITNGLFVLRSLKSQVAELFGHIGVPVELANEKEMGAITPVTALMAPYYHLLGEWEK